jgi:hypothetical protein
VVAKRKDCFWKLNEGVGLRGEGLRDEGRGVRVKSEGSGIKEQVIKVLSS